MSAKSVYKITIQASIEDVWHEITKSDEPIACFFGSVMDTPGLKPGAPIRMRTPNGKYTGVVGDILECYPPNLLSMTFKFTQLEEPPCIVTHQLKEVEGGTEYTLTNEKVEPGSQTEKYMTGGADFIIKTLKASVEKRPLPFKSKFILFMCKVTEPLTKKVALSVNWPFERKIE